MTALQMDPNYLNPWEAKALAHRYPPPTNGVPGHGTMPPSSSDPLIWSGLYSRTGLDVMTILALVATRPDPKIDVGPVDCGVALVVCERGRTADDDDDDDAPVVYVSEGFVELTGYREEEVIGRDCRFLQRPPVEEESRSSSSSSNATNSSSISNSRVDKDAIRTMRRAVENGDEAQVRVGNYRKDGTLFTNLVTIVPVVFNGREYLVGFHAAV